MIRAAQNRQEVQIPIYFEKTLDFLDNFLYISL